MKLYATTTSERASKGQGGNEYLAIDIMTAPNIKHYRINVNMVDNIPIMEIYEYKSGRNILTKSIDIKWQQKGKSQKGEIYCNECMKATLGNNTLMKKCSKCRK